MKRVIVVAFILLTHWAFAEGPNVSQHYRLATGDRISITVFGEPELSMQVQLSDNKTLNYPFLGNLTVHGHSPKELETKIADGLRGDYLLDPIVQVQIMDYRPFYIHGEVKKPGSYSFQPGMTVIQAVAMAGGFTSRAEKDDISIFRANAEEEETDIPLHQSFLPGDTLTIGRRFF